ncbi:F-box domain containing protein [Parasponia andersonii]|uniref:F-box domain containing protein n=1 Tax=Parasponia andersonii TaxID=3476 RepID=A0A2P5BLK9_PARAD|nr:F-box domain containing protein [Parasponia andersonii]
MLICLLQPNEPEDFDEGNTIGVDRISALPETLIHHILSFVPTLDVVRMSLISRRWRHMWRSVPAGVWINDMLNVTDTSVTSFKLDIKFYPFNITTIDHWLNLATHRSKVKELDLYIRTEVTRKSYYLHHDLFTLNSFTSLKLCGMTFNSLHSLSFPSLISLSLENVRLDDQFRIRAKFLEIVHANHKPIIEVEAMNLQSFVYNGEPFYCDLNLSSCETLTHLSLSNLKFENEWLEDLVYEHGLLESLSLWNCKLLLSDFSMAATNMLQVNVKLHNPRSHAMQWYFNLLDFLINLDCSRSLSPHFHSEEALILPSKFGRVCRSRLPTYSQASEGMD